MSAREHRWHVGVGDGAEQLDTLVQLVALHHLVEGEALRAVAADDEVDVREARARQWDEAHEEVSPLPPDEARHHHHIDSPLRSHVVRIGRKLRRVNRVWNDVHVLGDEGAAQRDILL